MKFNFIVLSVVSVCLAFSSCGGNKSKGSGNNTCPLCKGYESVNAGGRIIDCPICQGKGKLSKSKYNEVTEVNACPGCSGAGFTMGIACTICGGTGRASTLQFYKWLCEPIHQDSEPGPEPRSNQKAKSLCPSCHGSGRCQVCSGMGYTQGYGLVYHGCSGCLHPGSGNSDEPGYYKGDGKCRYCNGSGHASY